MRNAQFFILAQSEECLVLRVKRINNQQTTMRLETSLRSPSTPTIEGVTYPSEKLCDFLVLDSMPRQFHKTVLSKTV